MWSSKCTCGVEDDPEEVIYCWEVGTAVRSPRLDLETDGPTRNNSHSLSHPIDFGLPEVERFLARDSGTEPFSPTVRLGYSVLRV